MPGTLYLVATPIGNLADMSFRAVETLKNVALIACEDTRHTRKLLNHFEITNKLISYHDHNERERAEEIIGLAEQGGSVAVVSDAGTPGINDPGYVIVRRAIEAGLRVIPVPGASAFVSAVTVSGLPTDSIFFGGFLPSRSGERRRRLEEVGSIPATLVFYESPHRVARSLADCFEVLGGRRAAVVRELTKVHEEVVRGTLDEMAEHFSDTTAKGEFVLVIDRPREGSRPTPSRSVAERVRELEDSGMAPKAALKAAAKEFGISRSEAYRRLV
ncbi:MAG: 16S rRNA (cytidine(1402)-2'-O)-methyltransferase [Pyrinomonadaceae bacterium]